MGSYCQLYISGYPVISSKSYVSPAVMTMFRESDKENFRRHFSSRNQVEWGHVNPDEDDFEEAVEYKALTKHTKERLNVIGFSLSRVKNEFNEAKSAEVNKLIEWSKDDNHDLWTRTIEVLNSNTFEDYLNAFKTIISSRIHPIHYLEENPNASELIQYILNDNGEFYWGFPCFDFRCFLRSLLEVVPDDSFVVQDITDLVYAGYYDAKDAVCHLALEELIGDYATSSKIIVLTEGITDTEILKGTLDLLYPHLSGYYTFMDFGFKPSGGVGPLVNAVKSFAGAGIENRVIALFDNDTAAYSAVASLNGVNIPHNIKITHYPDISLAESYPAVGPNGLSKQNINKLACGIELYLGEDVLRNDGSLIPVQWKGYDERLGRYQGEILHKLEIQRKFQEKMSNCLSDRSQIEKYDWDQLREIFHHIFSVFSA
jgi:hypothetical protein